MSLWEVDHGNWEKAEERLEVQVSHDNAAGLFRIDICHTDTGSIQVRFVLRAYTILMKQPFH